MKRKTENGPKVLLLIALVERSYQKESIIRRSCHVTWLKCVSVLQNVALSESTPTFFFVIFGRFFNARVFLLFFLIKLPFKQVNGDTATDCVRSAKRSLAVCSGICYCCEINWSAKKWRSFFFLLVRIRMFILMTIEWTVGLRVSESIVEM